MTAVDPLQEIDQAKTRHAILYETGCRQRTVLGNWRAFGRYTSSELIYASREHSPNKHDVCLEPLTHHDGLGEKSQACMRLLKCRGFGV
jgi:hypothetical protein